MACPIDIPDAGAVRRGPSERIPYPPRWLQAPQPEAYSPATAFPASATVIIKISGSTGDTANP
jgi:hypothetical protein